MSLEHVEPHDYRITTVVKSEQAEFTHLLESFFEHCNIDIPKYQSSFKRCLSKLRLRISPNYLSTAKDKDLAVKSLEIARAVGDPQEMSRSEDDEANSYELERDERKKRFFFFLIYKLLFILLGAKLFVKRVWGENSWSSRQVSQHPLLQEIGAEEAGFNQIWTWTNGRVTKNWRKHGKIGGKGGGDVFCLNEFTWIQRSLSFVYQYRLYIFVHL